MTAQLHEKYDYVMIFTTNETDRQHLHAISGIRKERSYKMSKEVGMGRAIPLSRFLDALKEANLYHGQAEPAQESEPVREMEGGDAVMT